VHPDFYIFESLPGAGAVLAPRLPVTPSRNPRGLGPTTGNNEIGAATITQWHELWLSNGFASHSVAGCLQRSGRL